MQILSNFLKRLKAIVGGKIEALKELEWIDIWRHKKLAYQDLWTHYKRTFQYFWKERHKIHSNLFNEVEAEFLPAALSIQERPNSKTATTTARVMLAFLALLLLWSILGQIDIIVNASGKVIPLGYTKTIAAPENSVVQGIYVSEGQFVNEGDLLLELDSGMNDAELKKAKGEESVGALQVARSQSLLIAINENKKPTLPQISGIPNEDWDLAQQHVLAQHHDYLTKLQRWNDEIARYSAALPLVKKQSEDYKMLAEDRDVSIHAWMEKERIYLEVKGQLADAKNQRASLIAQIRKEAMDLLSEGKRLSAASAQDAARAQARGKLLRLNAPVSGTVQQLAVHTIGGVAPAAQPLMQIVPQEKHVIIEAFLENKDIGFVKDGQAAAIKLEAYDYTKFGTISGRVSHVSRDAIPDEKKGLLYSVKIALNNPNIVINGKSMPITPGMASSVEIKTGERRVIEYLISPLIQHQHEALRER
jgi:hemolysin D